MAYKDLREFIGKLEKEGELRRIAAEVDPVLEITEIADRVTRAGGPALLFERPKGSRVPLLINMLGSERRMNLALEVSHVDEVAARIRGFLDMQSPQGLLDKIKMLPKLAEIGSDESGARGFSCRRSGGANSRISQHAIAARAAR